MGALAPPNFTRTEGLFHRHVAVNKLMEAFMEATMENLGMLSLSSFAGGVLCLGLPLKPEDHVMR
jgi:hypothetical protein